MVKKPKKLTNKSKSIDKDGINYKKLFFELMSILAIAFGITVAILYPYINEKNKEIDKYEQYREILKRVDEYDYSKGRDPEFEKELDREVKNSNSEAKTHFYTLASGVYYCNVRMYRLAFDAFEYLDVYGLNDDDERLDVEARKVLCQRKQESEPINEL
jgi:hypothetical protein